jgi:hypothetical protein
MKLIDLIAAALALTTLAACGGGGGSSGNGDGHPGGTPQGNVPVTSTVSGTIADKSGAAIVGATVSVFHHNDNTTVTTTTDANGRYAVAGLVTANNADYAIYAVAPGVALYPAIADAAGSVTRFDFNGLYRTVIRFATLPARDVAGANFIASRAGDSLVSLPRTGQATSYAAGDDGAALQGIAWPGTRFTDNLDGSVSDHLTGLVWLKDAGCIGASDWSTALAAVAQLASGACGLTDASTAGQWRMPNANELESLVDVSQANPAVPSSSPFTNVDLAAAYWSSTTYMASTSNAMAIRFTDGRWINGVDAGDNTFNNAKTSVANATWAVRSGPAGLVSLLATGVYSGQGGASFGAGDDAILQVGVPLNSQRFIDRGDGTLADTETGLVWLKQADCINRAWSAALATVNALASGQCGLADGSSGGQWRMPNRREMLSIADRAPTFPEAAYLDGEYQASSVVTGPAIFANFIVSDYYWTSTTDAADPASAWSVYSCDFGAYDMVKTATRYSLAVR